MFQTIADALAILAALGAIGLPMLVVFAPRDHVQRAPIRIDGRHYRSGSIDNG